MYTFRYKFDQEVMEFDRPSDAIKHFDARGWGFHNFIIHYVGESSCVQLTNEEFFCAHDIETGKYQIPN